MCWTGLCPATAGANPGHPTGSNTCLDSTIIKAYPDGTGALKKTARKPSVVPGAAAPPRSSSGCRECSVRLDLEAFARPGQGDAPHGRELLAAGGPGRSRCPRLLPDNGYSAYQGDETLSLSRQLGYTPVVPPNPGRLNLWDYDRVVYRRSNEIERLLCRLKGYRRVFSRFGQT